MNFSVDRELLVLSQPSDKPWDKHTILYCQYSGLGGVDGQAAERYGRPFGKIGWVYVARAQGAAL